METLFENLEKTQSRLEDVRALLPSPLAEAVSFWDKLKTGPKTPRLPLTTNQTIVSLMQSIHIFHRSVLLGRVHLERRSVREFHVIYFGLGSATSLMNQAPFGLWYSNK